ncbi:MAG: uracil-DNA glycosylase family protein [Thermoflexales bacterium]
MGQGADQLTQKEAGKLLQWWLDAGVDTAISEEPRQWLKASERSAGVVADIAPPSPSELPGDYHGFRSWLETSTGLPLDRAGARRVLPHGLPGARIMLLSDAPTREDAADGKPIGGEAWLLATRMLAAIQLTPEEAYSASLACFHTPGAKLRDADLARCADIARHHISLVKPERLLLFGDGPPRALLGDVCLKVRGRVHRIEGVRTVATFHPRWLLQRVGDKALAWRDLLLLMEED